MNVQVQDKEFELYIQPEDIEKAITKIARKLERDYANCTKPPILLPILNGAFMFCASLSRKINIPIELEFVKLASYVNTESTHKTMETIGLSTDIRGRDIIIVEDILDTGNTLSFFIDKLEKEYHPKSIKIACLFCKPEASVYPVKLDYLGLNIDNIFVVGYGLDYNGIGRNLNGLYKII